jgi:hypothetical protein
MFVLGKISHFNALSGGISRNIPKKEHERADFTPIRT